MRRLLFPSLALLLCLSSPAGAQDVLIYRCVGAKGQLTLRDSPCEQGETQQTRSMQRPQDPPVRPAAPATPTPAPPPADPPPTRVVYLSPPRPMYECVTPDGERYASDNGDGQPRWVPYWTVGHAVWPRGGGGGIRPSPVPLPPHGPVGVVLPAGVWVRDECHALPQAEICARLSDRRYEILRRYGSAMPSERRELDREQRDIDARMANDCRTP